MTEWLKNNNNQESKRKKEKEKEKRVCILCCWSLVQFICSVVSDSLLPCGQQHARLPCPSQTPKDWSNSCPLCRRCHPTISSSVVPFSSCLQSFPVSGSFLFFFNFYFYFILLYSTVLVLPYIDMNPPRVYMRSQTWTPLPPPSISLSSTSATLLLFCK